MQEDKKLKLVLLLGALGGAALSVAIALLMDVLYADSLGGTWRDAIAGDAEKLFSVSLSPEGLVVTVLFTFILAVLGAFGALMGMMFSVFVFKLIGLLTRE